MKLRALCLLLTVTSQLPAREVAVTIDDLPLAGGASCDLAALQAMTARLLKAFQTQNVPVTGFVNESKCPDNGEQGMRDVLQMWLDAGAELGNHTYSHPDLNRTSVEAYKEDIIRGESITRDLLARRGLELRYFRHPFLHRGADGLAKREIDDFLEDRRYEIAPVTFDTSDYVFAAVYQDAKRRSDAQMMKRILEAHLKHLDAIISFYEKRTKKVLGRDIRQILLLHANELNADSMPELIELLRWRNYDFITLERALEDKAYKEDDGYTGELGLSWVHRWAMRKGMPANDDPDPPAFVMEAYKSLSRPVR